MFSAIMKLIPGGDLLKNGVMIVTILTALASGLGWAYSTVKQIGIAEANYAELDGKYTALTEQAGEAILKLQKQHAAEILATRERTAADAKAKARADATMSELEKELDDARKNGDKCLDIPLPVSRAERVRQFARDASGGSD